MVKSILTSLLKPPQSYKDKTNRKKEINKITKTIKNKRDIKKGILKEAALKEANLKEAALKEAALIEAAFKEEPTFKEVDLIEVNTGIYQEIKPFIIDTNNVFTDYQIDQELSPRKNPKEAKSLIIKYINFNDDKLKFLIIGKEEQYLEKCFTIKEFYYYLSYIIYFFGEKINIFEGLHLEVYKDEKKFVIFRGNISNYRRNYNF
jgi:hypothetical protein